MFTLVFTDPTDLSIRVEYKVDSISGNFQVFNIEGKTSAAIIRGIDFKLSTYAIGEFIELAKNKELELTVFNPDSAPEILVAIEGTPETAYSTALSFPIAYASLRIKVGGSIKVIEQQEGEASDMESLIEIFNANPDFNQYGVFSDGSEGSLMLTIPYLKAQEIRDGALGDITLEVYEN